MLGLKLTLYLQFLDYFFRMSKVCAIFGGSRGIGKAVAELLARKGCHLAIIARNLEVAQNTACGLGGMYTAGLQ